MKRTWARPLLKFLNISPVKIKRPIGRPPARNQLLCAISELDWDTRPDLRSISAITRKLLTTNEFKDRNEKWLNQQVSNAIKSIAEGPEYRGKTEQWKRDFVIDRLIKLGKRKKYPGQF